MRTVRIVWTLAAIIICTNSVHAQPAPNRAAEVASILASMGPVVESPTDDARRAALYTIAQRLDAAGDRQWGVLVKTDQGNKIPADILVWRPTMEHFDVMTGGTASPTWIPKGPVLNAAWVWQAPDAAAPEVPPGPGLPPASGPPASVNLEPLQSHLDASIAAALKVVTDAQAALLADEVKWRDAQRDQYNSLIAAINEPGWWSKVFGSRITQAAIVGLVSAYTAHTMTASSTR